MAACPMHADSWNGKICLLHILKMDLLRTAYVNCTHGTVARLWIAIAQYTCGCHECSILPRASTLASGNKEPQVQHKPVAFHLSWLASPVGLRSIH
jgi:hypothetical protein